MDRFGRGTVANAVLDSGGGRDGDPVDLDDALDGDNEADRQYQTASFDRRDPKLWIQASQRTHALRAIVKAYSIYRDFKDEGSAEVMRFWVHRLPSIAQHVSDVDAMGKAAEAELKHIEARAQEEREAAYAAHLRDPGRPDMTKILAALPPGISARRRALFRCILFPDWWYYDLLRHCFELSESRRLVERERGRARTERLERIRRQAAELRDAVRALDPKGRFHLGWVLARGAWKNTPILDGEIEWALAFVEKPIADLAVMPVMPLEELSSGRRGPNGRGHPRALLADAVLLDLAELFEEVAYPAKATRRISTKDQEVSGRDYGPFFEFARAVWVQVFWSEKGLSDAMKRWARARKSGARSPVIANINSCHPGGLTDPQHPVWGIFEKAAAG